MNKIEKFIYLYYEELIDDCFGYWLGFWYGDESFTLEETKELFFLTLKKLLDDNKVVLFAPYSMFNENTSQWDKTITIRKYGDTVWGYPVKKSSNICEMFFQKTLKQKTMIS